MSVRSLPHVVKRLVVASALVGGACAPREAVPVASVAHREAAPVASVVPQASVPAEKAQTTVFPPRRQADSLLERYLTIVVEGVHYPAEQFAGLYSSAPPCEDEKTSDGISSYWLARGRVLGYSQVADTLRASLELLTVAAQEPGTQSQYASVVTARIRTDTLLLKLVPDSARKHWQMCGLLSDGHAFGGYGQPQNIRYNPPDMTQAKLLAQVDSINHVSYRRIVGTVRDTGSGRAPLRTHVCAWVDSGAVRPLPRCGDVDSLGRYRIDSVRPARRLLTVDCETIRSPGAIQLAFEHLVVADSDLARDWRVTTVGCDSRPFRLVTRTFRGHYTQGYVANDFVPCRRDAWFLASDSLLDDPYSHRAWVTSPQGSWQVHWPSAPHDSSGNGQYYVEWRGTVTGPGKYGRRGGYPFELRVDSVLTVRAAQHADCD